MPITTTVTVRRMTDEQRQKTQKLWEDMADTIQNLWMRWQDEKDYEDWNDYVKAARKVFDTLCQQSYMRCDFLNFTKRPMEFSFIYEGWKVTISVTAARYQWKGVYVG